MAESIDRLDELAKRMPTFAGMSVNRDAATVIVYVTEATSDTADEFLAAFEATFGPDQRHVSLPENVEVKGVRFGWSDLSSWFKGLRARAIDGVTSLSVVQSLNGLEVRVDSRLLRESSVRTAMVELGIPPDAVRITEGGAPSSDGGEKRFGFLDAERSDSAGSRCDFGRSIARGPTLKSSTERAALDRV